MHCTLCQILVGANATTAPVLTRSLHEDELCLKINSSHTIKLCSNVKHTTRAVGNESPMFIVIMPNPGDLQSVANDNIKFLVVQGIISEK